MGAGWGPFGAGPGMEGAAPVVAGMTGGQVHFQAGLGFFPSLFGLQFVSTPAVSCGGTGAGVGGRGVMTEAPLRRAESLLETLGSSRVLAWEGSGST